VGVAVTHREKKKAVTDTLSVPLSLDDDGVLALIPGLGKDKVAKTISRRETQDALYELFERMWFTTAVTPDSVMLEIGCAEMGVWNCFRATRQYPNYVGVDIRRDYLRMAEERHRPDCLAICADLTTTWPFKDTSFDSVVTAEVLEHIPREGNVTILREAFRCLKPAGVMLIGMPVNTRVRKFHDLKGEEKMGHVHFWDVEDLVDVCKEIGFSHAGVSWGLSACSDINVREVKKSMSPDAAELVRRIGVMYGSMVARAVALSDPTIPNGGLRLLLVK
jgi:SAM-dependent methyltransferase